HAGVIYPSERDPRPLFGAIASLKRQGTIDSQLLRIDLRAPGTEDFYLAMLQQFGIADLVHILPSLPHKEALQDAANADALLLLQAANCNGQIPAKVYEYLRVGKPILALTPAISDTAALLRAAGGATIADLADEQSICDALPAFIR